MNRRGRLILLAAAGLALAGASRAPAQLPPVGEISEYGAYVLDELLGEDWWEQLSEDLDGQLRDWWISAEEALRENSFETLADLQPEMRALARWAQRHPRTRPYGEWLEARLEYFDVAREVVARVPDEPAPVVRPPAPPEAPRKRVPRVTVSKPPPSPAVARQRQLAAASREAWKQRMARKPMPAAAAALTPRLAAAFRREGVPEAWIWMAEVESSMNPDARSPAGAAGLFQLMPSTARALGLRLSPDDERLDPGRGAAAAARYLKYLYARFRDWPLVFAAYNAGEARVARLLKLRRAASFEAIAGGLPAETQMYVPRILETVRRRAGVDPARIPPPRADRNPAR